MLTNTDSEAETTNPRAQLPNLAAIQSRRAELLAMLPPSQREKYPPASVLYQDPSTPPDTRPLPPRPPTEPILGERALRGIAGQMARTLAPHIEAHPAALLLQFLAAFGNLVGPGPHCMVGGTRHGLNLFVVLVGDSSKARKGTSWNQIARLFATVDPAWLSTRVTSARLTAAGLVYALRDQQPPTDRRLLVLSEEFASVLHSLKRAKGQLSPLIRSAWDHGHLPALDQIRRLFHGHIATDRIDSALRQLIELSAIRGYSEPGRGRPSTLWSSVAEPQPEEPEGESLERESENPEEEGTDQASEEVSGDF